MKRRGWLGVLSLGMVVLCAQAHSSESGGDWDFEVAAATRVIRCEQGKGRFEFDTKARKVVKMSRTDQPRVAPIEYAISRFDLGRCCDAYRIEAERMNEGKLYKILIQTRTVLNIDSRTQLVMDMSTMAPGETKYTSVFKGAPCKVLTQ